MRVGDDRQIRPLSGRLQIGSRRRAALTVLLRRKDAIDAALAAIAIILVQRNACGNEGVDHILAHRLRSLDRRNAQWTVAYVRLHGRPVNLLCLQEIGETIVISTTGPAHRVPTVITRTLPTPIPTSLHLI